MIVLISVISGRIVPTFTRNWLNARGIKPVPPSADLLDRIALGVLHAGMIGWTFLPDWPPVGVLLLIAAVLNLVRLARWRGIATLEEPLLLVLHVGYLWLVVGVALLGLSLITDDGAGCRRGARADRRCDGNHDPRGDDACDARPYRSRAARRPCDDADLRPGQRIGGGARRCRLGG